MLLGSDSSKLVLIYTKCPGRRALRRRRSLQCRGRRAKPWCRRGVAVAPRLLHAGVAELRLSLLSLQSSAHLSNVSGRGRRVLGRGGWMELAGMADVMITSVALITMP